MKPAVIAVIPVALAVTSPAIAKPDAEIACVATAVYVEARGEPFEGQLAVAHVILNRTHDSKFPSSACAVISQPGAFPWRRRPVRITDGAAYSAALTVARIATEDRDGDPTFGALCFDRRTAPPPCRGYPRTRTIGAHAFYSRP